MEKIKEEFEEIEKQELPDSFCWAPYVNLDLDQDGSFYPCYRSKERQGKWKDSNVVEEYNNESMQTLRDDLWNGRENPNCVQCHRREAEGLESTRQQYNKHFVETIANDLDMVDDIIENHKIADISKIHTMEIRPHGMCTNACAHCDENSSSRWAKLQEIEIMFDIKYNQDIECLNEFWSAANNLKTVHFTGGEPLLYTKSHIDVLKQIPNKENIELRYHSSLKTMPHEDIIEMWQEFKHVKVFVSLDTSEKYFSYFRYGSNWGAVTETIALLREHAEIVATITVNCLTMMDFNPLVDYIVNEDLQLHVAFVDPPHQLSCVFMPNNLKLNASMQLSRAKVKAREYKEDWKTKKAIEAFDKIQSFMFTHYDNTTWHPKTLDFFAQLDGIYSGFRIYEISDYKILHSKQKARLKK